MTESPLIFSLYWPQMKPFVWAVTANALLLSVFGQSPASAPSLRIVKLDAPHYPPIATAARVSGDVKLKITIAEDGTARTVEVTSGPEMLKRVAMDKREGV